MATDREAQFPVEDFMGVDRQVDREEITARHFWSLQNLWEKKIGVAETRPGSEVLAEDLNSGIIGIDNVHRIFKSETDVERICAVRCTEDRQYLGGYRTGGVGTGSLPTGMSWQFVDAPGVGNWFENVSPDVRREPQRLILRFVGYGANQFYEEYLDNMTGYTTIDAQKALEITIGTALSEHIRGVEVYAVIRNGSVYSKINTPNYNEMTMWVGYINLNTTRTGTFTFYTCPLSKRSGGGAVEIHAPAPRTFNYTTSAHPDGKLLPGKTYYIDVMAQHLRIDTAANGPRSSYRQPAISGPVPVTIPEGHNSINIDTITPATSCYAVCIGEDPQMMQPVAISHNATFRIVQQPIGNPVIVDIRRVSSSTATWAFRHSDHSVKDMLVNVDDAGNLVPVHIGRMHRDHNDPDALRCRFVLYGTDVSNTGDPEVDSTIKYFRDAYAGQFQQAGDGARYDYTDWQKYAFFVNDRDPKRFETTLNSSIPDPIHRSGTSYHITDGRIAGVVVMDFQSGTSVRVPSGPYIEKFQESIVITGGDPVVDHLDASLSDSGKTIFFSRSLNPFDFTVPGAGSPTLQFFTTEAGGEKNLGLGIYTNTTGTGGPISQLTISKRNSVWLLSNLPVADSGLLPQTFSTNLSRQVGGIHQTYVNTPIGLIVASFENVYLLRGSGEPIPIGDAIAPLLQAGDMKLAVACYHDEHYKLSFYSPEIGDDDSYNNIEMWLDIRKMKAMKGQPSWKGPMVGRAVDYTFVEQLADGLPSYSDARDRVAIDRKNIRIYKADVIPEHYETVIYDFNLPVESKLETKDYEISSQDDNWNKLIKRTYWKCRVRNTEASPLKATEETYIDSELADTKELSMYGVSGVEFDKQHIKTNPFFPTKRIRGSSVRKVLTTNERIGIGGFVLHYQVERRRI